MSGEIIAAALLWLGLCWIIKMALDEFIGSSWAIVAGVMMAIVGIGVGFILYSKEKNEWTCTEYKKVYRPVATGKGMTLYPSRKCVEMRRK